MKKKNYTLLLMFMLAGMLLFSAGCKKKGCTDSTADNYSASAEKDDGSCSYTKGALKVRAKDWNGTVITGYEIWIYDSQTDFDNANPLKTKMPDANGYALFTNLKPGHYWADCEWTDTNGDNQISSGEADVDLHTTTTIVIVP